MISLADSLLRLPRERFALAPTPVQELARLRDLLGGAGRVPRLLIKRDDLNGVALGGNKLRKLEWLVADALDRGCDTLLTAGAAQSNHCRQTAGVGAMYGMEVHLCLRGPEPATATGNLVADRWLGAKLHFSEPGADVSAAMRDLAERLRQEGKNPYPIPIGGSNAIGAVGYAAAVLEWTEQGIVPDYVAVATGSGGTQAGIETGVRLLGSKSVVLGYGVALPDGRSWAEDIADLATATAARLGSDEIVTPEQVRCGTEYMGPRYGAPTPESQEALRLLARVEGVFLDPVYSAKAMAGLIDDIRKERFAPEDTVLFIHTGGTPALFA
ncbi:MAG: D-cysteine desulfhydrase family protein [Capsulimonadales bacterium]|nr:D-cysteine desulfhydrase family protein [Capsulimonadales bacterium]